MVGRRERLRLAEWQRLGVYGREGSPAGMRSVRFSLAIAAGAEMEVNGWPQGRAREAGKRGFSEER